MLKPTDLHAWLLYTSEDDNVLVQGVSRDNNALGFFGFAYYDENKGKLKAVQIVNPKGKAVTPSIDAVMAGEYEPLARPTFIYVLSLIHI